MAYRFQLRSRAGGAGALLLVCSLLLVSACAPGGSWPTTSPTPEVARSEAKESGIASTSPSAPATRGFVWSSPPSSIAHLSAKSEHRATKGVDYTEEYSTPKAKYGESFPVVYAIQSNGIALAAQAQKGVAARSAALKLGEYDGKTFTPFSDTGTLTPGAPVHGVAEVVVSGNDVVWVEGDENDLQFANWWVFAKHGDGSPRLLSESSSIAKRLPDLWWYFDLSVDNGSAYWLSVLPTESRSVPSYPWTAGPVTVAMGSTDAAPRVVTDGVVSISTSSGRIIGVRDGALNPEVGTGKSLLLSIDKKGDEETLGYFVSDGSSGIGPTAAAGDLLAFAVGFGKKTEGSIWVMNNASHAATEIAVAGKNRSPVIRVCGSNVLWTDSYQHDGSYEGPSDPVHVYDSATGALRAIKVHHNYGSLFCNGEHLAWAAFDDETASSPARSHVVRWHPAPAS